MICLPGVPQTPLPHASPPACETGIMFLVSVSPVPTWCLAHRLLACRVPRMWGIENSWGGEAFGKAVPATVQM